MDTRLSLFLLCLTAVLPLAFTACTPKETKSSLQSGQALSTVLAEETVRAAGAKKTVVVISPDASWGPPSSVEESFKVALKKQGLSVMAAKSANLGDPMRSGEVGLKLADFLEVLQKFPDAGAIASFAGAPLLPPDEIDRLKPDRPPLLVVATAMHGEVPGVPGDRMQLARLLEAKVIQLAIIDGSEPAMPKADATHELFAQHYRILRRPDQ